VHLISCSDLRGLSLCGTHGMEKQKPAKRLLLLLRYVVHTQTHRRSESKGLQDIPSILCVCVCCILLQFARVSERSIRLSLPVGVFHAIDYCRVMHTTAAHYCSRSILSVGNDFQRRVVGRCSCPSPRLQT